MHAKTDQSGISTVFFDLDGTLVDTAPDLATALNLLLQEENRSSLPFDLIRPVVSQGGSALIELGFRCNPDTPGFDELRSRFLAIYDQLLHRDSHLFPGMDEVLGTLELSGMSWGIITNKPGWLTQPLVRELALEQRAACIVSGDTTNHRKPHPAPMLHAMKLTGTKADECVYIGDAERDIAAGRAVSMHTLIACYGYLSSTDKPEEWNADGMIDTPAQILEWITSFNNRL